MCSASDEDEDEQLAALNDERDRAEMRDDANRELLELELQRLNARLRAPKEK